MTSRALAAEVSASLSEECVSKDAGASDASSRSEHASAPAAGSDSAATSWKSFGADRPLRSSREDRLNLAPFVKRLCDVVLSAPCDQGLVLAVHGAWGSGKSSALALLMEALDEVPGVKPPAVLNFSPWWFSPDGDILDSFLQHV